MRKRGNPFQRSDINRSKYGLRYHGTLNFLYMVNLVLLRDALFRRSDTKHVAVDGIGLRGGLTYPTKISSFD